MRDRIDSRDVLDADHRVTVGFTGRIVGHFQPTGADPWSDYRFVAGEDGLIDVMSGIEVQVEGAESAVRMRWRGRVVRVAWTAVDANADARAAFIAAHLKPFRAGGGIGAAAVIAEKLSGGGGPSVND